MPIQQLLLGTGASAATAYVTDNLVFHLDAADTNCYSGSGTTVNSLVNNHTNDHWGDITWSSDSGGNTGGYFEYDGNQDEGLVFPYSTDFENENDGTNSVSDFTCELWWYGIDENSPSSSKLYPFVSFQPSNVTGYFPAGGNGLTMANVGSWMFYRLVTSGNTFINTRLYRRSSNPTAVNDSNHTWTGSQWHHYLVTKSGTSIKFYRNNGSPRTQTQSNSNRSSNLKKLYIGGRYHNFRITGRIGIVRLYQNKALTASEVQQNYNAEKSRYGH
tara:strand:- start:30 stop:848 length:819 start_codon:yes stop_codon:yes gene_type:complete